MLRLKYGGTKTAILDGSDRDIKYLEKILTFPLTKPTEEEKFRSLFAPTDMNFLSGLIPYVREKFDEESFRLEVDDLPEVPQLKTSITPEFLENVTLHPEQHRGIVKALMLKRGLFVHPTGSGKTTLSAGIFKAIEEEVDGRVLMVVPGGNSLHQTVEAFNRLGIESVGKLGDSERDLDKRHMVAIVNSLARRLPTDRELQEYLYQFNGLLFMETQHLPAPTWAGIGLSLPAEYRFGLSATPFYESLVPTYYEDYLLIGLTGQIVSRVTDAALMNAGRMATPRIRVLRSSGKTLNPKIFNWAYVKKVGITGNAPRNSKIVACASRLAQAGKKVILLVNEIPHGKKLAEAVSDVSSDYSTYFFSGGSSLDKYFGGKLSRSTKMSVTDFAARLGDEGGYVVVGSPAVDEDVDFADANVLIMGAAGRSYRRIIQRVGRVLRKKEQNVCDVIDFNDVNSFILRAQSKKRFEMYAGRYGDAQGFLIREYTEVDDVVKSILST